MKALEFNVLRMIALMTEDYSLCEAFEKEGYSADVSLLKNTVEHGALNVKAKQALRKVYQEHVVEGDKGTIELYNSFTIEEKPEKVFPDNFTVEDCREFLKNKGYFVDNLWTDGDVIGKGEEMGHKISEEQAIEIFELLGRRHDATIGVNWDSIESVIEEYYS